MTIINLLSKRNTKLLLQKKWECKDGSVIKVKDLDDEHLINILRFLKRRANKFILKAVMELARAESYLIGEAALDSIDAEQTQLANMEWFDCYDYDALAILIDEVEKRNLDWEDKDAVKEWKEHPG